MQYAVAVLGVLAIAPLGGCNQLFGFGDEFVVDEGVPIDAGDELDAGPFDCPAAPPMTVIGCATTTHVRADGTISQSREDLTRYTVSAYVPDVNEASGFRVISGTASDQGVVTIEGVPDGPAYYLRLHDPQDPAYPWPRFFYTDQHELELGHVELGRDSTPVTLATQVTLALSGLRAWKARDAVQIDSFSAGTEHLLAFAAEPAADATSLDHTLDWREGVAETTFADITSQAARIPQLVDTEATDPDDLWVLHTETEILTPSSMRPYRIQRIVDHATPTGVTLSNGAAATITATLATSTPATTAQGIALNLDAFRTAMRDGNRYNAEDFRCIRSANPAGAYGLLQASIVLLSGTPWAGDTALSVSVPYANPFPTSWPQVMNCTFSRVRDVVVPISNRRLRGFSYINSYTTASDNLNWSPGIRSPTNVRVGDVDGITGGAVDFDGVAPVEMSWDAVPGVNRYQIRVRGANEGFVAAFDTSETSVSMPGDLFVKGNYYQFRVFAIQTTGNYAGGHLYEFTIPLWVARLATGLFLFSSDCGNSAVDLGEQCDTAGNTASCDADCSLRVCGDGFINSTMEACDEAGEGPLCDDDCTAVMCTDGNWNRTIEQCDDGNAVDNDGCSSACVLTSCGDGTTQAPFEQCDDGNRLNGDGCGAFCQPD